MKGSGQKAALADDGHDSGNRMTKGGALRCLRHAQHIAIQRQVHGHDYLSMSNAERKKKCSHPGKTMVCICTQWYTHMFTPTGQTRFMCIIPHPENTLIIPTT